MRHKVFVIVSENYRAFFEKWFLGTLKDDFDLKTINLPHREGMDFESEDYKDMMRIILEVHHDLVMAHQGEIITIMDADIQFFRPCTGPIMKAIEGYDMVLMPVPGRSVHNEIIEPGNPRSVPHFLNGGVMTYRCNEKSALYNPALLKSNWRDLPIYTMTAAQNYFVKNPDNIRWSLFPPCFVQWKVARPDMVLHHAVGTIPVDNKSVLQLKEEQMIDVRKQYERLHRMVKLL